MAGGGVVEVLIIPPVYFYLRSILTADDMILNRCVCIIYYWLFERLLFERLLFERLLFERFWQ